MKKDSKLYLYQATVIFSVLFSLIGFSYNVWRMEASEQNNNVRTACFEMLVNLSDLEQLIYSAYYDQDEDAGSPRKGWVTVGLIVDLSSLSNEDVERAAVNLKIVWSSEWSQMSEEQSSVDQMVVAIDNVRLEIKNLLNGLE